jgi:hypothetical protein
MRPFHYMLSYCPPVDFQVEQVILLSVFRHKLPGLKRAVMIDVPAARRLFPPAAFHTLSKLAACAFHTLSKVAACAA